MRLSVGTLLLVLAAASCGGTSFVLKQPLIAGCQEARIPAASCPDLADGMSA